MLQEARSRTLLLARVLDGERLLGPKLGIVNPPLWEIGHVGWFQEYWCLRHRSDGTFAASTLAGADGLYNSAAVPHAVRWDLPLPDFDATLAYLQQVLERASASGPDFITLAGSGEPALYQELGTLIERIKAATSVPVALLTNGALLIDPEVRRAATLADLVMPSLDAGEESTFQFVNRPVEGFSLEQITEGLVLFRDVYRGPLWLEVMILRGVTDQPREVRAIAERARRIRPDRIQLNTPIRPSSRDFVFPVRLEQLEALCSCFEPKAQVIAPAPTPRKSLILVPEVSGPILEMLRRRSCTVEDICTGLGTSAPATLKVLEALLNAGAVQGVWRSGCYFFKVVRGERVGDGP
jgi:wyosine [tRNA(Phe)-imidazoG37] synthetase (radical SAM superfamily)